MKLARPKQKASKSRRILRHRKSESSRNCKPNWKRKNKMRSNAKLTLINNCSKVSEAREEIWRPNWSVLMNRKSSSIGRRSPNSPLKKTAWLMTTEGSFKSIRRKSRRPRRVLRPKLQLEQRKPLWREESLEGAPRGSRTTPKEGRRLLRGGQWLKLKRRPTHSARAENLETNSIERKNFGLYPRKEAEAAPAQARKTQAKLL